MTESEHSATNLAALPRLPRDGDGPVFVEPWQAQAFALAVLLSQRGYFTWQEWVDVFADELRSAAAATGSEDGLQDYYRHWLSALERLAVSRGLTGLAELASRKEAWADAYRHTPHGQPVTL